MSFLDTVISDVEKAEAGASSVVTFVEGLWSKAQTMEGNIMQLFDEAKERASEIANAVEASPTAAASTTSTSEPMTTSSTTTAN